MAVSELGFVPFVSQPLPLQVPVGNMDVDILVHVKAELLSYIPLQQLETRVSRSCSCT